MHLRALIVLLLAMNLGVALWWALRPAPAAGPPLEIPADVPRLVLVSEADEEVLRAAALNAANAAGPDPAVAEGGDQALVAPEDLRCFSFGPWAGRDQAARAHARLKPLAVRLHVREAGTGATGWRVMLPPLEDRTAALRTVERLVAAGFDDHFVIAQGDEANAVALGRFSTEEAARRHEAALRGAGFTAAVAEPLGTTGTERWLDLAAGPGFDPGQARQTGGAPRVEPLDCARLQ